jgi:hypothetical protein
MQPASLMPQGDLPIIDLHQRIPDPNPAKEDPTE